MSMRCGDQALFAETVDRDVCRKAVLPFTETYHMDVLELLRKCVQPCMEKTQQRVFAIYNLSDYEQFHFISLLRSMLRNTAGGLRISGQLAPFRQHVITISERSNTLTRNHISTFLLSTITFTPTPELP